MTVIAVQVPEVAEALSTYPEIRCVQVTPGDLVPPEAAEAEVFVPGFLVGSETAELMAELPKLTLVQLLTAGAEVWVGRTPAGVTVCTASGAHGGSTAEWALGALLAVLHEFPLFARRQAEGVWDRHQTDMLAGKRVLVIGSGDLGQNLQRRLLASDAIITMAARSARDGVIGIDEVPAALPEHDVVVLMVPLTPDTRGMVDAEFLRAMPDGAVLVNAARGPVVDTDALLAELTTGRLRAALDVTDPEPLPPGHPLWSAPNVFITPHIAGAVPGASDRALAVVRENLARFRDGEKLLNVVGPDGY